MTAVDYVGTISEALSSFATDREWEQTSKRWGRQQLSQKLFCLRSARKWTRKVAAQAAGIPESALRNYELMKSAPKEEHLEGLANAFGIRAEALRYYDFSDTDLIAQAFFQFAATYGFEPVANERYSALKPTSSFMQAFLKKWAARYAQVESDSDRDDYERWKDNFAADFDPSQFPLRYEYDPRESWILITPWQNRMQSKKLPELRARCTPAKTQPDLARETDLSLATLRSYEQGARVPKFAALQKLSAALGVKRGALVFTDFGSPVQAAHALFQLSASYGLIPVQLEDGPVLLAREPVSDSFLFEWAKKYETRVKRADEYDEWLDRFSYFEHDKSDDYVDKFRQHTIRQPNGSLFIDGHVYSDFCPFDERFKKGYALP